MDPIKRILLARFEIQAAIGGTVSVSVLALAASGVNFDAEPVYATFAAFTTAVFLWMAVVSRIAYGQSLEELDAAVEARAAERLAVANAETLAAIPEGSAVDRSLLEDLLR